MGTRKSLTKKRITDLKVGSSPQDAAELVSEKDFGVAENDVIAREYASQNTRRSDRGSAQAHSNEEKDGVRESGAGGDDTGTGSSSGSNINPQFVGIAGGTGLADDIEKEHHDGPDDSDGSSREMGSSKPTQGFNNVPAKRTA